MSDDDIELWTQLQQTEEYRDCMATLRRVSFYPFAQLGHASQEYNAAVERLCAKAAQLRAIYGEQTQPKEPTR